jgi:predicted TIM-barrel fold metal-dependent hydrolase
MTVDCDIHNELPSLKTLYPYLADHWVDYCNESAFVGPDANDYPKGAPLTARPESKPAAGGPPGSDLELVRSQVLDAWLVEVGILTCAYRVQSVHNLDLAAALATAINRWQIDEWLAKEPRLRASLVVSSQNPDLAAQEIDRFADHAGFVQVVLPVRSLIPYGNRFYDPIFAAAVRHNLVVGIHYGGAPGHPPTPTGWPSTFLEEYAGMAQVFQSQVISLVIEGAFDRFPELRVALIEGGWTWMPSLMWRIDKEWKGLRHNTPWVKRLPSDYMRRHIRLTLQPLDAPPDARQLLQVIEQMESDEMLMFSTDYPHWHFDSPDEALPAALSMDLQRKIRSENARKFYQL